MCLDPFEEHYDIAVIGGGLCGVAASLRAAMDGKRIILIEGRSALGWEVTWAYELTFDMSQLGVLPGGAEFAIVKQFEQRMESVGGLHNGRIDAPATEILLDRWLDEAGVDVLLFSFPEGLFVDGEDCKIALATSVGFKCGKGLIRAKVFVDATEDGLLWRQAGASFRGLEGRSGKQVIAFNHAAGELTQPFQLSCPNDLGVCEIIIQPSLWHGEAFVEFTLSEFSIAACRIKVADVVEYVRKSVDALSNALVTHTGHEPMPVDVPVCTSQRMDEHLHPHTLNLVGAGLWACEEGLGVKLNGVVGRLAWGEIAGAYASQLVDELSRSSHSEKLYGDLSGARACFKPHHEDADIAVIGGGTAGAIAAIAAAMEGANAKLLEWGTLLGGMGTAGAIHTYYYGVKGGLQDEIDERVDSLSKLFAGGGSFVGFHPEAKKVVLTKMAFESGVDLKFLTLAVGALAQQAGDVKRLKAIEAVGVDGSFTLRAHSFIDCTGDGDVAALCGAEFILGRDSDGLLHAYSQPAGILDSGGRLSFINIDAGYVDPTDLMDMTRARRQGIRHYWRERFTEGNRLLYIAPLMGIRQGRHIIGDYQLTLIDEIVGRKFDDVVSYTWAHYDNHSFDYENESDEAIFWTWVLGQWGKRIGCEVPYRCMLPKGIDGLLVACRAISLTVDAHHEFRMLRDMQRLGEVAAVASVLALKRGLTVRSIDIPELQNQLRQRGLLGDGEVIPNPLSLRLPDKVRCSPETALKELPQDALEECERALYSENPEEAVWVLAHDGEGARGILQRALQSDSPKLRFYAAAALAMLGFDDGADELIACVSERRGKLHEGMKAAPVWIAAITMLGRLRCKAAVPVLIEVLKDASAPLDALIASVRALGKIGDESACDELLKLLKRSDLPTQRQMQVSVGTIEPVVEDARWQIELATAEALAKLGKPVPESAKRHIDDERAYVRRYARRILELSSKVA
ncbi:MAG: FAD-dependent oxidoreductase [Armatimonadota bacterium]|nr:FAD-dependent oxidoreductase [Armatimonadota bacterium]MCX7778433.1 FAD-dependent oxidoreductase [Armatimonadota bacterium]MDW8025053.1 FAD-dependent oxidoreductase [Armatimonadota bacterium]